MRAIMTRSRFGIAAIEDVAARFPVPLFLIGCALLILLSDRRDPELHFAPHEALKSIGLTFLVVVAVELFTQARQWPLSIRLALSLSLGAAVYIVSYYFDHHFDEALLYAIALLMIGLAPSASGPANNLGFWQSNYRLWLAAGFALACALVLGGGAALIVLTLNILFGEIV